MTADELVPKAKMLSLIVSQLASYGYANLAKAVAEHTNTEVSAALDPSNLLVEYCFKGMKSDDGDKNNEMDVSSPGGTQEPAPDTSKETSDTNTKTTNVLDWETADFNAPAHCPNYTTPYITIHQAACRTAAYSWDGKFIATGSVDSTSKLFDASKIDVHSENPDDKPVIRTLYDHSEPVNGLSFHPNGLVLASCSDDLSTKLYDISKPNVRRSFRYFQDAFRVNSICFHPSGDYLVSGTDHTNIRVYDVRTFQCYTPGKPENFHVGAINSVRFSKQGNLITSASMDGNVKIWDGVSGDLIRTFENAHKGAAVTSCELTSNNKYILTSGLDSIVRLWEISSGRLLQSYQGAVQYKFSCNAVLNYDEKFVFGGDESSSTVVCWNALTGQLVNKWSGHTAPVRCIATSPIGPGFVSCSEDSRARFWAAAKSN